MVIFNVILLVVGYYLVFYLINKLYDNYSLPDWVVLPTCTLLLIGWLIWFIALVETYATTS